MFKQYEGKYFKKALTVRGNHDYFSYWGPLSHIDPLEYEYNNVVFLGTTLWTPIHNNASLIEQYMTDYHNIAGWMGGGVAVQNEYYKDNVKWLCEKILYYTNIGKDLVIVTHHLPFKELILPKYSDKSFGGYFLNSAFAIVDEPSPFEEFLKNTNIKAWIVGHTHTAFQKTIGNIPFYCNPFGYKNEHDENTTYQLIDIEV